MRILYLSYWVFNDALTTATVLPHLRVLEERADVEAILLVTVERGDDPVLELPFTSTKITYTPLLASANKYVLVKKTDDFLRFPSMLAEIVLRFNPDMLIARGALAGSLAYLVWKKTKLPFYVESFEPHAEYMLQGKVWRSYDPRYLFQQYWENQQKRHASGLMPVAEKYRRQLIIEGVSASRMITVPCSVDLAVFAFRPLSRARVRQQFDIAPNATVGIYAGKFGGIYFDYATAFDLFRTTFEFFGPGFHLVLLTPEPAHPLRIKLQQAGLDVSRISIAFVPFSDVPDYLSAADFAFGLHRPTPYVSPIKIGEYWANGLPVLLSENVGDDSDIIQREGGGALFQAEKLASVQAALGQIAVELNQKGHRAANARLAAVHRSLELAKLAYENFFRRL